MSREVVCGDAVGWLAAQESIGSVITSMPDVSELRCDLAQWKQWSCNCIPALSEQVPQHSDAHL
jgi:hypothetical protein